MTNFMRLFMRLWIAQEQLLPDERRVVLQRWDKWARRNREQFS